MKVLRRDKLKESIDYIVSRIQNDLSSMKWVDVIKEVKQNAD